MKCSALPSSPSLGIIASLLLGLGSTGALAASEGDLPAAETAIEETVTFTAEEQAELEAYLQYAAQFDASLEKRTGTIELPGGIATLNLPEGFYYLGPADTRRVLEEAWGNPPSDDDPLGMLFPATYGPLDMGSWGVTIEFVKEGYVSDKDAAKIDYDDLLRDLQKETRAANKYRAQQGYPAIDLKGWAADPFYDATTHKMHWAQQLHFEGEDADTLNYNIRVLGRRGYLRLNFIAAMDQFDEVDAARETVLAMTEFNAGHRYSDFDPSMDKVAAYGIGALVAGKVAAKTGLIAKILLATKKLWIVAVLGIGGLVKWIAGKKAA